MATYNGWTNWDTWNMNLHITNEYGLYDACRGLKYPTSLKLLMEGIFDNELDGIDFDAVNWLEILEGLHE